VKGRDWFDFVWYVARKTRPDLELLRNALHQHGPWSGRRIAVALPWVQENLAATIRRIDWSAAPLRMTVTSARWNRLNSLRGVANSRQDAVLQLSLCHAARCFRLCELAPRQLLALDTEPAPRARRTAAVSPRTAAERLESRRRAEEEARACQQAADRAVLERWRAPRAEGYTCRGGHEWLKE
jgi:hypothetical protein